MNYTQPRLMYTPEELAYVSGFFDAEGCISIAKNQGKRNISPSYELYASLSCTDKSIIEWLNLTFGGSITDRTHHAYIAKNGYSPAWNWRLGTNEARDFLVLLLPYLKIKHIQAAIGIESQDYKKSHKLMLRSSQGRQQEILARHEEYYQHLNSLHNVRKEWTRSKTLPAIDETPIIPGVLTSTTLAYIGGFLDGEGCIRISKSSPSEKRGKGHLRQPSYALRVKMSNTNKRIIEWLCVTLPSGSMQRHAPEESYRVGWTPAWEWIIANNNACQFLEMVIPYLKIKRQQAALAIENHAYYLEYARYIQGTRPQEIVDRQEVYRLQINGMNAQRIVRKAK